MTTYSANCKSLRALEEATSRANNVLVDLMRLVATGDREIGVLSRVKETVAMLVISQPREIRLSILLD